MDRRESPGAERGLNEMKNPFIARRFSGREATPAEPAEAPRGHRRRFGERVTNAPMAVAVVAMLLSLTGSAVAAKMITGKQIKDASITGKDVKDRSLSGADFKGSVAGPQGPRGPQGPAGPAGSAVAYAHVTYPGGALSLDQSRSKNITAISEGPDFVCIDAAVPVKSAIADADFNGGASPIADAAVLYDTTGCPPGTDIQVATKYEGHGLVLTPFTVWFN
jgi:hypothetical protein